MAQQTDNPKRRPTLLANAAMKSVKQWKYEPLTLKDEPVIVETTIKVHFQM